MRKYSNKVGYSVLKKFFKIQGYNKISSYNIDYLFVYYYYYVKNVKGEPNNYTSSYYQNNLFFIQFFILKFFKKFISKKKLLIQFKQNYINIKENRFLFMTFLKKIKHLRFLKETNLKIKSFLNLILMSLHSKDATLLKNAISSILEDLPFKKHKRFLYSLKVILRTLAKVFFIQFKCKGLYIKIKGKIGVGGNLKKRKFLFKLGSFSLTSKMQRVNYSNGVIKTYSGILGLEVYLSF
jgi:hypothetical protein